MKYSDVMRELEEANLKIAKFGEKREVLLYDYYRLFKHYKEK